jgi:hypothetical protein
MTAFEPMTEFQIRRFKPSFEALGIVVDYVSRVAPFDGYQAKTLVRAVEYQIVNGFHVAGFSGETLVGYCGWLQITRDDGELWLAGNAELKPAPPTASDAVALHIVRIDERAAARLLIRACRNLEPKKRVYFKREYAFGSRETRRNTVMNL